MKYVSGNGQARLTKKKNCRPERGYANHQAVGNDGMRSICVRARGNFSMRPRCSLNQKPRGGLIARRNYVELDSQEQIAEREELNFLAALTDELMRALIASETFSREQIQQVEDAASRRAGRTPRAW